MEEALSRTTTAATACSSDPEAKPADHELEDWGQLLKALRATRGVGVVICNHPRRDGALEKMERLAARGDDEPHPFVNQEMALAAFETLHQCALAQADRIEAEGL